MDVNPYQSPEADLIEENRETPQDERQPKLDRGDILFFGAMAGAKVHAAAGVILGFLGGVIVSQQDWASQTSIVMLPEMGAIIGAITGNILGCLAATLYGLLKQSKALRIVSSIILHGLHMALGAMLSIPFVEQVNFGTVFYFEISSLSFHLEAPAILGVGLLIGFVLSHLLGRRIRRTLDTLAVEDTQTTPPQ